MRRIPGQEDPTFVDVTLCTTLVDPVAGEPQVLDHLELGPWMESRPDKGLEFFDGLVANDLVQVGIGFVVAVLYYDAVVVVADAEDDKGLVVYAGDAAK